VNCAEITECSVDGPGQHAHKFFLVQNVDFNRLSLTYWVQGVLYTENANLGMGLPFKTHYQFIARCTLITQVAS